MFFQVKMFLHCSMKTLEHAATVKDLKSLPACLTNELIPVFQLNLQSSAKWRELENAHKTTSSDQSMDRRLSFVMTSDVDF